MKLHQTHLDSGFVLGLLSVGLSASIPAQTAPSSPAPRDSNRARSVDTMRVTGRIDKLNGIAASASEGHVGLAELRTRLITREGELLESVPGLIVTPTLW